MLVNIILGLGTMILCLFLQAILLVSVIRYYLSRRDHIQNHSFLGSLWVLSGVMLLMVLANLGQAAIWALLFQTLGEFDDFAEAFYHSVVNFATLGYGDFVMSEKHKLLGPLEAVNGVLMIGISSAVLFAAIQNLMKTTRDIGRK